MLPKILITGARGFVGARLCAALRERFEVIPQTHAMLDITDPDACKRAVCEAEAEAVFHFAAISSIPECEKNPEHSYQVNVQGSVHLARACEAAGAKLVYASTDQVYTGLAGPEPHRENEALNPTNVYARHKLEAERRIAECASRFVSLRLSWMFDLPVRGMPAGYGVIRACAEALLQNRAVKASPVDYRGITDVWEVCKQIPAILDAPCGVYNFGSENTLSTYEVFAHVFEQLGGAQRMPELLVKAQGYEPRNIAMNTEKAQAVGILFSTTEEAVMRLFAEYGINMK